MASLLLLEFLHVDQLKQERSEIFPYLHAYARELGHQSRWLVSGFDPADGGETRFRALPPKADRRKLLDAVKAYGPTHVLSNEPLADDFHAALIAAAPDATFTIHRYEGGPFLHRTHAIERWLGSDAPSDSPEYLVDHVAPRYDCEIIPGITDGIEPFVQVLSGPVCYYAHPVAGNPLYKDVDLSGLERTRGCSFCGGDPPSGYPYQTAVELLVATQVEAATRECPHERNARRYVLLGSSAFLRIRPVFDRLLTLPLPPSHFFLFCRLDEVSRRASDIEALLPRLRSAGHTLNLFAMGAENLSPAENERLNKGLTPEQIATAVRLLFDWEKQYPDTLRFREAGGLSFITFTPWTRLEDLDLNLSFAQSFQLPPTPLFFTSRLQLFDDRSITRLAARDNLLHDRWPDPASATYDSGCQKEEGQHEIPWRFQNEDTALVYGVMSRMWAPPGTLAGDPVADRLRRLHDRTLVARLFSLMGVVLEEARAVRGGPLEALLTRLEARAGEFAEPNEKGRDENHRRRADAAHRLEHALRSLLVNLAQHDEAIGYYEAVELRATPQDDDWQFSFTFPHASEPLVFDVVPRRLVERPVAALGQLAATFPELKKGGMKPRERRVVGLTLGAVRSALSASARRGSRTGSM